MGTGAGTSIKHDSLSYDIIVAVIIFRGGRLSIHRHIRCVEIDSKGGSEINESQRIQKHSTHLIMRR
jgi:hypothetical protein